MEDVLKPLHIYTYTELKQKAIESTRSHVLINNMIRNCNPNAEGFCGGAFRGFQTQNIGQKYPFFSQSNNQGNHPQRPL